MVNTYEVDYEHLSFEVQKLRDLLYRIHEEAGEAVLKDNDYINALQRIRKLSEEGIYR